MPPQREQHKQRKQRKQNLLLASRLARGQAVVAIGELGGHADRLADTIVRVRDWVTNPLVWTVGSTVGALLLSIKTRRVRSAGVLSWIWPAWRAARGAAAVWAAYRAGAGSGRSAP